MSSPFSLKGKMGRVAYVTCSVAAFFVQHLFAVASVAVTGATAPVPWWFWFNPLRAIAFSNDPAIELMALAMVVVVDWLLVAFAFRRARDARRSGVYATWAVVPIVQVIVILWLALAPRLPEASPEAARAPAGGGARAMAVGLLAGVALSVAVVAFSTLVLRLYGYGLFLASPAVIGMAIAFLANREAKLSLWQSTSLVFAGLGLSAMALVFLAFEGVICLVMAAPLIAVMGFVGGLIGRAVALARTPAARTMACVALTPLLLLGELAAPPRASFESVESVDIAATPAAVWDAIVHMGPIPDPPPAPFRWGLAYPLRGEIAGEGVGAIRRGVFSTGIAYERVTEWAPHRKLISMS